VKYSSLVTAKRPCEFPQPHLMLYSVHSSPGLFAVTKELYFTGLNEMETP